MPQPPDSAPSCQGCCPPANPHSHILASLSRGGRQDDPVSSRSSQVPRPAPPFQGLLWPSALAGQQLGWLPSSLGPG